MFLCREEILQISTYPTSVILGFLAFLVDAYQEKERSDPSGNVSLCTVLHLHPQLAPVKVAVLSQLPEQNELCEVAQQLSSELREAGGCIHVWVTGVCRLEGVSASVLLVIVIGPSGVQFRE